MSKWILAFTGYSAIIVTINYFGIRNVNDYNESANANQKLNEIKQNLNNMKNN